MADKAKKKCFVISPIGDPNSEVRAEADWLLKGVIRPALEPDFVVERADIYPKNDVITNQIILAIKNADLIVADLSGHNPNVLYELAVAHAYRRPVIPMIRDGEKIPFDNHQMGTIFYSRSRFEQFEQAKTDLRLAATETQLSGYKVTNPITMAATVEEMKSSPDDKERVIAELSETVAELKRAVMSADRSPFDGGIENLADASIDSILINTFGDAYRKLSFDDRRAIVSAILKGTPTVTGLARHMRHGKLTPAAVSTFLRAAEIRSVTELLQFIGRDF